ncbi:flavin reductase family protein [Piscinibacter sp.]|uniref:flavin reductase family protein n=1 Tax=Piscinibacter sp. TaxID=1903157 RepID=UPI0039E33309
MYSWTPLMTDAPLGIDALGFRRSLGAFPTGVCLVTTVDATGKREGVTVNSFASVSLAPPLVLWSIRDEARSSEAFVLGRHFIIHVLGLDQQDLAQHFARPAPDKFAAFDAQFAPGIGGCPRLRAGGVATYECTTYSRHQEGDHTILVGRVARYASRAAQPLVFHAGRMGSLQEIAAAAAGTTP